MTTFLLKLKLNYNCQIKKKIMRYSTTGLLDSRKSTPGHDKDGYCD